jgi:hypothetical protein
MANARRKGHDFERAVAQNMREIGFEHCVTSRAESKNMDDAGVDLCNLPLNIQCKNGYEKSTPNFRRLRDAAKIKLAAKYPKDNPVNSYPFVLLHKTSGNDVTATIDYDYFKYLLANQIK